MTNYKPSRRSNEYERRDPIHADSRRRSNDEGLSSPTGHGTIQIGNDGLEVALVADFSDEFFRAISRYAQAASRGAHFGLQYFDPGVPSTPGELLTGGLAFQSAEDIKFAFGIRGASRVLTHQLVRTRKAGFKQQSQRDCWYGPMPEFRMPESIWCVPALRMRWIEALQLSHAAYDHAIELDIPYEDARYILPEGTTNFILCEYDLRTFMEMYAYRGCVMFQNEMVAVQHAMRELLVEAHPYLEPHLKISCERVHKCTFQGDEPTAGTCNFPWARKERKAIPLSQVRG